MCPWCARFNPGQTVCRWCKRPIKVTPRGLVRVETDACVKCGSTDVRTFDPLMCGPCYVKSAQS
jgi:hypothetical protein